MLMLYYAIGALGLIGFTAIAVYEIRYTRFRIQKQGWIIGLLCLAASLLCVVPVCFLYAFLATVGTPGYLYVLAVMATGFGIKSGWTEAEDDIAIATEKAAGRIVRPKGKCPWCGNRVRPVVEKKKRLGRDRCRCPECNNPVVGMLFSEKEYVKA